MRTLSTIALFALLFFCSGCSTYDKVAVWYKYRNDFKLPRNTTARVAKPERPKPALANAEAPEAVAQTHPGQNRARKVRSPGRVSRLRNRVELLTASALTQVYPERRPVWEDASEKPDQDYVQVRPYRRTHWASTTGFLLSILSIFLLFSSAPAAAIVWIAAVVAGFVISLIGVTKTGPNKPYKGLGLAIAGLVITSIWLLLLLLIIVLIAALISSQ